MTQMDMMFVADDLEKACDCHCCHKGKFIGITIHGIQKLV